MRRPASGIFNARRAAAGPLEPIDELRLRVVALPLALVVAALFSRSQLGHPLQRMLFGMPLHELGHALTAVALGVPAFPLPWFTPMADSRSPVLVGLLLGGATSLVAVDVASTWWAARRDPGEIPLGQFESGGLSDASVLVETTR